jgi:phage baseplate assembly protein W|tara:strand:- start:187 stop:579 length:393 start_codon:yes stop_codon:yes gene_type:complete
MPTFQTFKDLSVTFKKHPVTNDLVQVKDKAAIVQAMTALILTRKGERLFQPELGCDVQSILFEPLDFGSAGLIKSSIKETLVRYEPRIRVNDVLCTVDYDNNGYEVEVYYTIIGREDQPVGIQFFLERTR